ncbi:hypothetical protein CFK41_00265 [Brachybacterium ginsengisoli]|uniref:Uncharacterized protein n=1 Tax=Brachybacterium ginsengisoli TaxID=1331682 RepID=A0A291GT02_9MICO|nr:hypothetical protein CFK41_00265 [Brachybacterium ginsengisoli]
MPFDVIVGPYSGRVTVGAARGARAPRRPQQQDRPDLGAAETQHRQDHHAVLHLDHEPGGRDQRPEEQAGTGDEAEHGRSTAARSALQRTHRWDQHHEAQEHQHHGHRDEHQRSESHAPAPSPAIRSALGP